MQWLCVEREGTQGTKQGKKGKGGGVDVETHFVHLFVEFGSGKKLLKEGMDGMEGMKGMDGWDGSTGREAQRGVRRVLCFFVLFFETLSNEGW